MAKVVGQSLNPFLQQYPAAPQYVGQLPPLLPHAGQHSLSGFLCRPTAHPTHEPLASLVNPTLQVQVGTPAANSHFPLIHVAAVHAAMQEPLASLVNPALQVQVGTPAANSHFPLKQVAAVHTEIQKTL